MKAPHPSTASPAGAPSARGRLRILMLTDYFHPHIGGVEEAVYAVGKRLVAAGHTVHVLTFNTNGAPRREVLDGMVVRRAGAVELTRLLRAQSVFSLDAPAVALAVARELQPDLIHAHNLFFTTALIGVALRQLLGRPLVTTMQLGAMDQLRGLTGLAVEAYEQVVGRVILRRSDAVIAVSQAVAEHGERLGGQRDRLTVIPNGVDSGRFAARDRAASRGKRVVLLGRLISNKGPQFLLEAAPSVLERHPDAEFVVVGDGPLRASLEARVRQYGVEGAFRFLGERSDVPQILETCAVMVRPSLTEGLPLAVLEAMAGGLPVVATPVGGTAEAVVHGRTGLLVRPGSVDELARGINTLLDDPDLAARLGANGRTLAGTVFSWDRIVDATLEVYRDALSRRAGAWARRPVAQLVP